MLTTYPVREGFVAEIGDLDLSRPLAEATVAEIRAALSRYAVLIFPEQDLDEAQQLAFAASLGPIEPPFGAKLGTHGRLAPALVDVSNLSKNNSLWKAEDRLRLLREGDKLWHTDSSFNFLPAYASILHAKAIVPVGGLTEFADERAAYDDLSPAMKAKLDGLIAEHSWFNSRKRYGVEDFDDDFRADHPPVPQMLVRTLPESGRKTLYLALHIGRILGLPDDEAAALVDELVAHATSPAYVYRHRWRVGDVVMWDNRCTMHHVTDYDDLRWPRDYKRATLSDVANTLIQEGVPIPEAYRGVAAA